jgi:hypothetical protein
MKALAVVAIGALTWVAPARPAAAKVGKTNWTDCPTAIAAFPRVYRTAWRQAGRPAYKCTPGDDLAGEYSPGANTAYIAEANAQDGDYRSVIAHETGHAYAARHHLKNAAYRRLRGFPTSTSDYVLDEDYAETFSYWLGVFADWNGASPYGFHTVAGIPTERQLLALRASGMLPPRPGVDRAG